MKKLISTVLILAALLGKISAQTLINEKFNTVPPTGWTKVGSRWLSAATTNAGGTANELVLNYNVEPNDYLRTSVINTTGLINLNVNFKTKIDHYVGTGGYACKVQSSTDGAVWKDVWIKDNLTTADYGPANESFVLTSADGVGSATLFLQFIFTGAKTNFNYWYVDDLKIENPLPMSYTSSNVVQAGAGNVLRGNTNVKVLQIPIVTTGSLTPLVLNKLTVNTDGTTDLSKISNAKIYYTGNNNTFATTTQLGTVVSPTLTNFDITGTQTLSEGTNYFWLTFDVAADAADGSVLDAECTSITLNGEEKIPSNTDPLGSIIIKSGMSGTKTIGATGNYSTITAALADLNSSGLEGPVLLELQSSYVSTAETFPLPFKQFVNSSPTNTVTIRPASDALDLTISTTQGIPLNLNGTDYLIVDGRPAGTGTSSQLTIVAASTSNAIMFSEDATNNIIRYCEIKGSPTTLINFATTSLVTGNDNNIIEYCNIHGAGTNLPTTLIYSSGTLGKENSGNVIRNNSIYDFFNAFSATYGINVYSNSIGWTLNNNSFYQTAPRVYGMANIHRAIKVNTGNGYTISGNIIGGSNNTGGGTAWMLNGTVNTSFYGIELGLSTGVASVIQDNTIKNISTKSAGTSGFGFVGILVTSGDANIGAVDHPNIIGDNATASIKIDQISNSSAIISGVASSSTGMINIDNNKIGSIVINSSEATKQWANFYGIYLFNNGTYTVTNNTIGHETTANSISDETEYSSTGAAKMYGIYSTTTGAIGVVHNLIANINYAGTGIAAVMNGIRLDSGNKTVNGNTVSNLITGSANTGTGSSTGLIGISVAGGTNPSAVNKNVISGLKSTAASAKVGITGLYYGGSFVSTASIINGNKVTGLDAASSDIAIFNGIFVFFGKSDFVNNMILLGNNISAGHTINGIYEASGQNNFYNNSVYISGNDVSGTANSYAFNSNQTAVNRKYVNNILINNRSNGSGMGKHYGILTGSDGSTFLTSDYNCVYAGGTGAVFGAYGTTDVANFTNWKATTTQDANSQNSDILFDTTALTEGELKFQRVPENQAVYNMGTDMGISTDFYGTARPQYAAVDIGAYELQQGSELTENVLPTTTSLAQNYPNPFNPETTINFTIAKDASINLTMYNAKGEIAKSLVNNFLKAGCHSVNFNAIGLNSGVYIYKLTTPENSFVKKMLLVK